MLMLMMMMPVFMLVIQCFGCSSESPDIETIVNISGSVTPLEVYSLCARSVHVLGKLGDSQSGDNMTSALEYLQVDLSRFIFVDILLLVRILREGS